MKRLTIFTTISALAVATAAPALAGPGGGHGAGGGASINVGAGARVGGAATIDRGMGRGNANALGRINNSSSVKGDMVTGSRIPIRSDTSTSTSSRVKGNVRTNDAASTGINTMSKVNFGTDITGHAVVDSTGATIGTVTGVTTKGNGSVRTVQVTLTNGQIITLAPNSLNLANDVLTTNSLTSNVRSQGAAHANINGLIHASPNSALASAGVTSLTGLATDLTVNNSAGDPLGTVQSIVTNRSGAVVGINLGLTSGGTVFVPATTLSMNGTTVVTSSTQF
jgi:hypothetical protein